MDLIDVLHAKNKSVLVLHPLFEAFIQMKWVNCSMSYYIYLVYSFFFTFLIICNSLVQFSHLKGVIPDYFFLNILKVLLPLDVIDRSGINS